jgi:hypothetical protein
LGIGKAFLLDLINLKKAGAIDGFTRVVEIGAQQLADNVLDSTETLDTLFSLYGCPRPDFGKPVGEKNFANLAPSSRDFWTSLGFAYAAIEFHGYRDSIPINLNCDSVPENMRGKFQLVINTGTTEHVANQDNAFRIIHDLVCKNGIMYHEVPTGEMFNHGLISYNLQFFHCVCRENNYRPLFINHNPPAIRCAIVKTSNAQFVTPLDVPAEILPSRSLSLARHVATNPDQLPYVLSRMLTRVRLIAREVVDNPKQLSHYLSRIIARAQRRW